MSICQCYNKIIQFAWFIYDFLQINHVFCSLFDDIDRRKMKILIVKIFKFFKIRINDFVYSFQWINDVVSFQNVLIQFRFDIERFRNSNVFRNFLIKFSIVINSKFSNSIFFSIFRLFKLETSILSISSISFDVFSSKKFRRNNVSKIHVFNFIFSSITFNYLSIITLNTSIDFAFNFNFVNIRDISIKKIIYTQFINFVMFDQKQNQNQNQFYSIIQIIITTTIIAIVFKHLSILQHNFNVCNKTMSKTTMNVMINVFLILIFRMKLRLTLMTINQFWKIQKISIFLIFVVKMTKIKMSLSTLIDIFITKMYSFLFVKCHALI